MFKILQENLKIQKEIFSFNIKIKDQFKIENESSLENSIKVPRSKIEIVKVKTPLENLTSLRKLKISKKHRKKHI